MTDKQKNIDLIGRRTFLFAWIVIGVLATYSYHTLFWMVFPMMTTDMSNTSVGNSLAIIIAFTVFSGAGFLQQYVLYRFWGIQIRHWWWVTGVGFAISQITFNGIIALLDLMPFPFIDMATVTMVISLSLTIQISVACSIQAFLLRNYLKRIWLYIISTIVGSLISGVLMINIAGFTNLSFVLYGVATGLALLWLDHITYEKVDGNLIDADRPSEELA